MIDVGGDDRAAAGDLVADELWRDVVRDGGAEAFSVAAGGERSLAAEDAAAAGDELSAESLGERQTSPKRARKLRRAISDGPGA